MPCFALRPHLCWTGAIKDNNIILDSEELRPHLCWTGATQSGYSGVASISELRPHLCWTGAR